MVWSFLKNVAAGPSQPPLRQYAVSVKEKLAETNKDDGVEGVSLLSFVLEYAREELDRTIEFGHGLYLAKMLTILRIYSPVATERFSKAIDALISKIDRGIRINAAAERAKVADFERQHDAWLESTRPLLNALIPLLPTLQEIDGNPDFVGEVYVSEKTLLSRAANPHLKIHEICRAMLGIRGSGVTRDAMPDFADLKQGRGDPEALVHKYLGKTVVGDVLLATVESKTYVPLPVRFEHTHVLGGTGHGKTQFLQSLILKDLQAAQEGKGSLVVIDGQGDLIRKITRLKYFDPDAADSLADKLVLIDANDVEFPVAINMFALNEEQMQAYSAVNQERIFNATISLYEYFFGALLGADLTQRQGLIFKFLARLLFKIPDATIHTFLDVMENGETYRHYMDQLDPTSRRFFEQQFFDKSFDDTKQQIATRLWGVISNSTIDRLFSTTETKFDFFEAINSGKIILINTAKDLLQADGNAILGRFFIALLARAILQRQVIPEDRRRATFAYIDEVQDYIQNDNKIEDILNQARKYKAGLVCAHQNLEQLSREQRASFAASTTTKFVGGISAKDARALAHDMRTTEAFLLSAKKEQQHTNFACFVKNITPEAIMVPVTFGQMEEIEQLSDDQYERLIEQNRATYCVGANVAKPVSGEGPPGKRSGGDFELGDPELL
ncbi:type IV secretory system conjugative DNA transfer family protein [Marimonas sp. MJW-29]|uniref:Type IV secretory system conjugative DNA transfer family protein n=1 Tax=Sulfitobacter sediminis TaxID=3234186 RepID=A0ABV3RMV9_9RHOB